MPRRWGVLTRIWVYRYLVLRDGERCARCGKIPTTRNDPTAQNSLDIDHIDGNPRNADPSNLRLLCRSCNVALENHSRTGDCPGDQCECESAVGGGGTVGGRRKVTTEIGRVDVPYREGSPEMQANLIYEVPFRRWVLGKISEVGSYSKADAIAEGAEVVGCSPTTTARYLSKLTSPSGPLQLGQDVLGHPTLVAKERERQPLPLGFGQSPRTSLAPPPGV